MALSKKHSSRLPMLSIVEESETVEGGDWAGAERFWGRGEMEGSGFKRVVSR